MKTEPKYGDTILVSNNGEEDKVYSQKIFIALLLNDEGVLCYRSEKEDTVMSFLVTKYKYWKLIETEKKPPTPPLGLVPKWLRDEQRLKEIEEAIERYYSSNLTPPQEWNDEHIELQKIILTRKRKLNEKVLPVQDIYKGRIVFEIQNHGCLTNEEVQEELDKFEVRMNNRFSKLQVKLLHPFEL